MARHLGRSIDAHRRRPDNARPAGRARQEILEVKKHIEEILSWE